MKLYPALDVRFDSPDLLLALVDDFSPTALEERDSILRVFFQTSAARDQARAALEAEGLHATSIDVSDEDWAKRSQADLPPITVGRITITANPQSPIPNHISIVITPSMGFGTGHHATTRLCLEALQRIDLRDASLLDVGTGSGVLAIAAEKLGAARAMGIDVDADAIQCARENHAGNGASPRVSFHEADLFPIRLGKQAFEADAWDVLVANLTGAMLVRAAARLLSLVRPGGRLILSGIQTDERDDVASAFPAPAEWEREDAGWVALAFRKV